MLVIYKKVFRELILYKNRTIIALFGIIIGVFSIGFVLTSYAILNREMDKNFMSTNPASIIVKVSNLDEAGVDLIKGKNKDLVVEVRKCIQARINRGNGTYGTIYLYGIRDFEELKVDTFILEKGRLPKAPLELAIERDSLCLLPNVINGYEEEVNIKIPGCLEQKVEICGRVHAPGLPPASMEKYSYGFMSIEGLQALGAMDWYDEIHIVYPTERYNQDKLKKEAKYLQGVLAKAGYKVNEVKVPMPGKHPHHEQLESFIFLLEAFTIMSLLIACMIVGNLFNAIMNTQKKQLAIMKVTGATTWEMTKPYFIYALLLSVIAEIIALPMALAEHLKIIINFLSVISVLAIIVGGMSMASIIGISISERKREMGIFRAIGASDEKISKMITMEVALEGLLSWIVGCVLAYPISIVTGNFFGQIFLHSNLQNVLSLNGMMIWFGLSLLVAVTAGLLPGRSICKESLREMLAYE